MRLYNTQLGVFVPGHFSDAVPQNPVVGAGMAAFVPGSFDEAVPQNPVTGAGMAGGNIGYFTPGMFTVPQMPVGLGEIHGLGCGGNCGGSCGGLGSTFTDELSNAWTSLSSYTVAGMPVVYLVIGGLVLWYAVGGVTGTRSAKAAARAKYRADVKAAQQKYGIVGRTRRAVSAFQA